MQHRVKAIPIQCLVPINWPHEITVLQIVLWRYSNNLWYSIKIPCFTAFKAKSLKNDFTFVNHLFSLLMTAVVCTKSWP